MIIPPLPPHYHHPPPPRPFFFSYVALASLICVAVTTLESTASAISFAPAELALYFSVAKEFDSANSLSMAARQSAIDKLKVLLERSQDNDLMFPNSSDEPKTSRSALPIHVRSHQVHLMSKVFDEYRAVKDLHS